MGFRFFNIRRLSCCKKPYSFYYVQTIFYSTMLYCKFYFFSVIDFLLSCNCRRCFILSLYNTIGLFYISTHIITVLLSFFHLRVCPGGSFPLLNSSGQLIFSASRFFCKCNSHHISSVPSTLISDLFFVLETDETVCLEGADLYFPLDL